MIWIGLAAVLGLGGFAYLLLIAPVGCSYKAKILCSSYFLCGREIDPDRSPEISADAYKILRLFRAKVDRAAGRVTVSFLGLRRRTAVYLDGGGAVLRADPGTARPWPHKPPAHAADPWRTPKESSALSDLLDGCFPESNPRRLRRTRAVVVLQDGRLVAERYAPGFSERSLLPGWSMTKAVVHALTGVLVKQGALRLDGKSLLPQWKDGRAEIALEDLLRMRSGLAWTEDYANPLSDVNQMLWNSDDASAYAAAKPLGHAPGTFWQYSSGTTNIVCRLIKNAVPGHHHTFPRQALFAPLGMANAHVELDASTTMVGSSFMFATARDWARFGLLYAQDGVWEGKRILPEGWAKFGATPTPQSKGGCYGAHWWLKLQKELGGETEAAQRIPADAFYALGHEDQSVTVIPSRKLVAVRLGLSIYIDAWNHAQFVADLLDALA